MKSLPQVQTFEWSHYFSGNTVHDHGLSPLVHAKSLFKIVFWLNFLLLSDFQNCCCTFNDKLIAWYWQENILLYHLLTKYNPGECIFRGQFQHIKIIFYILERTVGGGKFLDGFFCPQEKNFYFWNLLCRFWLLASFQVFWDNCFACQLTVLRPEKINY